MSTCTATYYIQSATSLKNRLNRIILIIEALELKVIDVAVNNSDIDEYTLDDGQVKISTKYRNVADMEKAIEQFEKLKQKLFNQLNGRNTVLRPHRGLQ